MDVGKSEYWDNYWDANGPGVNQGRREKYKNDPAYRQSVKDQARQSYNRNRRKAQPASPIQSETKMEMGLLRVVVPQGFYDLSFLGRILGRRKQTIYRWVRGGVIPKPAREIPFRGRGFKMQFSGVQVQAIVSAFMDTDFGTVQSIEDSGFTERIQGCLES